MLTKLRTSVLINAFLATTRSRTHSVCVCRDVNYRPEDQPDEESDQGNCRQASHEQDAEEDR
jgi:hypothetical protein